MIRPVKSAPGCGGTAAPPHSAPRPVPCHPHHTLYPAPAPHPVPFPCTTPCTLPLHPSPAFRYRHSHGITDPVGAAPAHRQRRRLLRPDAGVHAPVDDRDVHVPSRRLHTPALQHARPVLLRPAHRGAARIAPL